MYACLGATCQQNDQSLLYATEVTWGGGGSEHKKKSAQKVNSGEENSPSTPTRNQSHDLSIMSAALHQLSYLGPLHLVQRASYSPATFMKAWSPEAHWRLVVYTGTVSGIPLPGDKPKNKPLKTISFSSSQLVAVSYTHLTLPTTASV